MEAATTMMTQLTGSNALIEDAILTIYDTRYNGELTDVKPKVSSAGTRTTNVAVVDKRLENPLISGNNRDYVTKTMIVQYNPSRLTFSAGPAMSKRVEERNQLRDSIDQKKQTGRAKIDVHVPLVFDAVVSTNAFTADRLRYGGASYLAQAAIMQAKGKFPTVQPQVEALIGALHSDFTREVCFTWGKDMSYRGVLSQVNAEYTMFSPEGHPIRANVNLTITCADVILDDSGQEQWLKYYEEAFATSASSSSLSLTQKAGGWVNL